MWAEARLGQSPDSNEYSLVPYLANTLYQFSITRTGGEWFMCAGNDQNISQYECIESDEATGTSIRGDRRGTGVFFETGNTHDDWHTGFSSTISASSAKIYRSGTPQAWSSENRITQHHCDESYPPRDAMSGSLTNNGTGSWTLSEVPIACP